MGRGPRVLQIGGLAAVLGPYHSPLRNLSIHKNDFLFDEAWNHVPNRNVSRPSVRALRYELHEALNDTDAWLA